jgi:glycosyltransferase involved in cell wall biosynthesis
LLLCISRISYDKGIKEFIKAVQFTKKENPKGCFVSTEPIENSEIRINLAALKAEHLKYLDPLEDIKEVLASAHIAVLPSYHEGLSRFLMESLSMGKVLIRSDIPRRREMMGNWKWLLMSTKICGFTSFTLL